MQKIIRLLSLSLLIIQTTAWGGLESPHTLLAPYQAPQKLIGGESFPRLSPLKYRGIGEAQYNLEKAIEAMLGEQRPVESKFFSAVKLSFLNQNIPYYDEVQYLFDEFKIHDQVNSRLKQLKKTITEDIAVEEAMKLLTKIYQSKFSTAAQIDPYLNYLVSKHIIYPVELVYTTLYPDVANIYSKELLVIQDFDQSMIDLNYWNFHYYGHWSVIQNKWADLGEFVSPLLIPAHFIIGYLAYDTRPKTHTTFRQLPNELNLALYKRKTKENFINEILIFKTTHQNGRQQLISLFKDKVSFASSIFNPMEDFPPLAQTLNAHPEVLGLLKACPIKITCEAKEEDFSPYLRDEGTALPSSINNLIGKNLKNKKIKLFRRPGILQADENQLDLTKELKGNNKEKILIENFAIDKKIHNPNKHEQKTIIWKFNGLKVSAGQSIILKTPKPIANLGDIHLEARQTTQDNSTPMKGKWDESPAYLSFQIFNENDGQWYYPQVAQKHSTPYNSFFITIDDNNNSKSLIPKGTSFVDTTQQQTIWGNDSTTYIRIHSVGVDPLRLYEVKMEYLP